MNCPKCNLLNEQGNLFCVNCGETLSVVPNLPQTVMANQIPPSNTLRTEEFPSIFGQQPNSQPTVISGVPNYNQSQYQQSQPNFNPSIPYIPSPPVKKSRTGLWIGLGLLLALLLGGGAIGAFLLLNNKSISNSEALPTNLGMFFQNSDKTQINEIKKFDYPNALTGKDALLKESSLPAIDSKPNIVLYSDSKDVSLDDLKFVSLDSINKDGSMKQIEFKAAPVEGKPDMKRIWFNENLANGKYAFALFDGYFDEGKHKFWAVEVKNSDKSDNGDLARTLNLDLKAKTSTPEKTTVQQSNDNAVTEPKIPAPANSTAAFCTSNNVVLRSGASQSTAKIGGLYKGQKLYVLQRSGDVELFVSKDGREHYADYAYVQTEGGKRGWVYSYFIR